MKKLDRGQMLQLLGNAGVIIGILLLVYELNQNREMMMAQTRHELSQGLIDNLYRISTDEQSADIVHRGNSGESLTELESFRYTWMTNAQTRYHEDVFYQYRVGLYDEAEYAAHREAWRNNVYANKGVADTFCSYRPNLSPEFVAEIEGLLTSYRCG